MSDRTVLEEIQRHAAALPLALQSELLNYAVYLEQRVQAEASAISEQGRREGLAAALAEAAALNPFSELADPVDWQRNQRADRSMPGRTNAR